MRLQWLSGQIWAADPKIRVLAEVLSLKGLLSWPLLLCSYPDFCHLLPTVSFRQHHLWRLIGGRVEECVTAAGQKYPCLGAGVSTLIDAAAEPA